MALGMRVISRRKMLIRMKKLRFCRYYKEKYCVSVAEVICLSFRPLSEL